VRIIVSRLLFFCLYLCIMIIYNSLIPFRGFVCINLCGVLFVRRELKDKLTPSVINHEAIHTEQIYELFVVGFYVWYLLEWIIRLIQYRDSHKAYRNISFEREAYDNEHDEDYIFKRRLFNFIKYI